MENLTFRARSPSVWKRGLSPGAVWYPFVVGEGILFPSGVRYAFDLDIRYLSPVA
jgi:hypothetical protein